MGWTDSHLHEFQLPKGGALFLPKYALDELEDGKAEDENSVVFHEVCARVKDRLMYTYDFGDFWEHDIVVEKIVKLKEGERVPVCLNGKNSCPPEDCGGPPGYENFVEIISDPEHEEFEETVEWVGGNFDPEEFDLSEVNRGVFAVFG